MTTVYGATTLPNVLIFIELVVTVAVQGVTSVGDGASQVLKPLRRGHLLGSPRCTTPVSACVSQQPFFKPSLWNKADSDTDR